MCIKRALLTKLLLSTCMLWGLLFAGGCGQISFTPPSEQPVVEAVPGFQEAQRLFAAGRFEEAIEMWEQIPSSDPRYLDAQLGIRQARLQINQITEREVTSEQEISQFDRYIEQAEQFEQQGDFHNALEMYEEARLLAPENTLLHEKIEELHALLDDAVERHKALGELYFAQGEYEKAKQEWERLLLIEPGNEQAQQRLADIEVLTATSDSVFFQRGRSLMQKGLINQATAEFQKAQRVNPNNPRTISYVNRLENIPFTEYTVQKGDTLSSIAEKYSGNPGDFTILVDFNRLNPQEPLNIGQKIKIPHILNFQQSLDPQGENTFAELDEEPGGPPSNATSRGVTAPNVPVVQENLTPVEELFEQGIAAYNQRNYREAMQIFQQVYERNPENQEAYEYFLQAARAIRGGTPIVRVEPETVEQNQARDAEIDNLSQQGVTALNSGNPKMAIAIFEEANQLAPQNREVQEYLEKARDELKKLITFHLNEGIKFFNKEALEDAILEWDKVLELDPENPQAIAYRQRAKTMLDALASPQ